MQLFKYQVPRFLFFWGGAGCYRRGQNKGECEEGVERVGRTLKDIEGTHSAVGYEGIAKCGWVWMGYRVWLGIEGMERGGHRGGTKQV